MSDVAERVKKIVIEHLGVDESKVSETASFIDDLGADSLDTVELVMAFEEEFGCEIPDDAAEKILTIQRRYRFHQQREHLSFAWLLTKNGGGMLGRMAQAYLRLFYIWVKSCYSAFHRRNDKDLSHWGRYASCSCYRFGYGFSACGWR